jgi:hypothetical protein
MTHGWTPLNKFTPLQLVLVVCQRCVTNLAAAAVLWKMEEYDTVYTYLESGTYPPGLFTHSQYHFHGLTVV